MGMVDAQNTSRILGVTDSQCTRCLQVKSYGSPCDFCADEVGLFGLHASCRQRLSGFRPPCVNAEQNFIRAPIDVSDRPGILEAAQACMRSGNVRNMEG